MEVTQPVDLDSNLISGFCSHVAEFSPSCRSRSSARWAGNPSAALSATGNTSEPVAKTRHFRPPTPKKNVGDE